MSIVGLWVVKTSRLPFQSCCCVHLLMIIFHHLASIILLSYHPSAIKGSGFMMGSLTVSCGQQKAATIEALSIKLSVTITLSNGGQ